MTYGPLVTTIASILRPELTVDCLEETSATGHHGRVSVQCGRNAAYAPLSISFDAAFKLCGQSKQTLPDWLYPLFQKSAERKSCDHVIFWENQAILWVVLVELKSKKANDAWKQILCTQVLVEYVLSFCWMNQRELPQLMFRAVILTEKGDKRPGSRIQFFQDRQHSRSPARATIRRPDILYLPSVCYL